MNDHTPIAAVCNQIASDAFKSKISQALPPGVSLDRFTRTTLTALQQNPQIATGDRQALYLAITRAAQDGLLPDGREGAIVMMAGKPSWMPMVSGLIKRLAECGISITAQVVYEHDEFDQDLGDDERITHKPPKLGTPRGKPLGAYAIARTASGLKFSEVMDFDQIEQVRQASRSKDGGPWKTWWTEMARKTVIRRLFKRLPITDARVAETVQRGDDDFSFDDAAPTPVQPATQPAGQRRPRVLQAVAATVSQPEPAPAEDAPPFDTSTADSEDF